MLYEIKDIQIKSSLEISVFLYFLKHYYFIIYRKKYNSSVMLYEIKDIQIYLNINIDLIWASAAEPIYCKILLLKTGHKTSNFDQVYVSPYKNVCFFKLYHFVSFCNILSTEIFNDVFIWNYYEKICEL
jgi:hypothetical protein